MQSGHFHPVRAGDPDGVPQDDFQLHRPAGLPVEQHAGLRACVSLRAGEDLLWRSQTGRELPLQDRRHGRKDLVHAALEMLAQVRVADHDRVAKAPRQHRRWVHRAVDADLVPADELQIRLVVVLGVAQFSVIGEDASELAGALVPSLGDLLHFWRLSSSTTVRV